MFKKKDSLITGVFEGSSIDLVVCDLDPNYIGMCFSNANQSVFFKFKSITHAADFFTRALNVIKFKIESTIHHPPVPNEFKNKLN